MEPQYITGKLYNFHIEELQPTQPDDGNHGGTDRPIEVAIDQERLLVINGNHRYWGALSRGLQTIAGYVIDNPYDI